MADYKVVAEKYRGKHKLYKKNDIVPEAEIFGDIEVLLNGQKDKKNRKGTPLPNFAKVLVKVEKKKGGK